MTRLVSTVFCGILISLIPLKAQDFPITQLVARVELHPIQTLTISDDQFLKGEKASAKVVTIVGELRIARRAGRLPVVVLIHGSNGITAASDTWTGQFNEMGISTFVLDAVTGREITDLPADQSLLGRLNFIVDAYRALGILAKHPRVDSSKIALMGFSRGGQATLYASLKRFHRMWNNSGVEFAGYIPFYPDCSTSFVADVETADRPIRIFHGRPDDANPVAPCIAYVERLRRAGRDVQLTEYPNAHHGFDNPLYTPSPLFGKELQVVRRCSIQEEAAGRLINAVTKKPFTYQDPCVERGAHVGYDPAASRAAHQAVGKFVKQVFELK